MSEILKRWEYERVIDGIADGSGWARDLLDHDAAQRARIAELERDLAVERQRVLVGIERMALATKRIEEIGERFKEFRRIGTGAMVEVKHHYE